MISEIVQTKKSILHLLVTNQIYLTLGIHLLSKCNMKLKTIECHGDCKEKCQELLFAIIKQYENEM